MSEFADLKNVFTYQEATPEQIISYQAIRNAGLLLAKTIEANSPDCPDQTIAINKAREAVMWANAAIALEGGR